CTATAPAACAVRAVYRGRLRRFLEHRQRHPLVFHGAPSWRPWVSGWTSASGLAVAQRADLRNRRPNHFWVESDGRGSVNMPGYPKGYCENHYIHSFELEDGRIKRNREFMNPFQQLARPRHSRADHSPRRPTRLIHNRGKTMSNPDNTMGLQAAPELRRQEPPGGRAVHADQGPGPPAPPRTVLPERRQRAACGPTTPARQLSFGQGQARRARGLVV
ncbi:hypothetical protein, partial [Pseudomonas sp. FEN]